MGDTMISLALAAFFFTAIHLLVSGTRLRDALVLRLGERVYTGIFSLASAGILGWLILAYSKLRVIQVTPLYEHRWLAAVLVFIAFVFIVLGVTTRGPTLVGGEGLLKQDDGARGIHRVTRHPFLWGFVLWAGTHMAFNPGLMHWVFFGTFLIVGLAGTYSIDAKRARSYGEAWQRYTRRTSNLPFAAIIAGRNELIWRELGISKLLAVLAAYIVFALLHTRFFGIAPF